MSMPLTIDIVSDPVCPWCYIGKRRLEKALAACPDVRAEINWLPFQLSPDLPREGVDRREHYRQIFGAARATTILESLGESGLEDGLEFRLEPGARSPNTLSAHVLMYWAARDAGVDQNQLAEKLFAAHHTHCEDLGDIDVLCRIAAEVGFDAATVRRDLETGRNEAEVKDLIEQARSAGVSGVPFFILDRRLGLSGAQPPELFVQAIRQAIEAPGTATKTPDATG